MPTCAAKSPLPPRGVDAVEAGDNTSGGPRVAPPRGGSGVAPLWTADVPSPEPETSRARQPSPPPERGATAFPETWRALVDAWKREKPLQARKLEDTHPLKYGEDEIMIAVHAQSPCYVLLARDEQVRIREQLRELFGFTGALTVVPAEDALARRVGGETGEAALPDTILTERAREGAERRVRIRAETEAGAFAKEALAVLGGAIEDIAVR